METPFAILWFAAKTALRALGGGVVGDLLADVLPAATRDFLKLIGRQPGHDPSLGPALSVEASPEASPEASVEASVEASLAQPKVRAQVQRQLELVAQAPKEQLRQTIKQVVKEVGRDQPREVRQAVASYLAKVPGSVRRALKQAGDPTGTTVPPGMIVLKPEDLLSLFPQEFGPGRPAQLPNQSGASVKRPAGSPVNPAPSPQERTRATMDSTRITLVCTAGVHQGRSYTFAGHDTFLVGRSKRAHFQLPPDDKYFSRIHFMIELNPPACRLMDMGSRNGTYVNGARVSAGAELNDGDHVKAGRTAFEVKIERPAETVAYLEPLHDAPLQAPPIVPARPTVPAPPSPAPPSPAPPSQPRHGLNQMNPARSAGKRSAGNRDRICPACGEPMPAAALVCAVCQEQALGQEQPINGYLVIRELGRGGMGVVRLAVRHADGRAVALKTIMPAHWGSRSQVERFLREARILQELDHPNIVAFRDMGKAGDLLYFAMDFIQGQDASKILKREGPIAVRRAVAWTCELLQALDYAHAKGFVHRDIKPGNLLMDAAHPPLTTGGRRQERVRLADFGLARVYQNSPLSGLTLQGDVAGTYAFMAPEQITSFRESKPSVDLYAVAATLYNLLTAKTIFDMPKEAALRIMMILHDDPVPIRNRRSDVPKKLADIIHRTLRKDPEDRYADAKTLRRALLEFAE